MQWRDPTRANLAMLPTIALEYQSRYLIVIHRIMHDIHSTALHF
jgi:hypothetical protein